MRWISALLLLVLLSGCPKTGSHPLQICDDYEPCDGPFDCVGFRCIARCKYEGDCDPGSRCVQGQCLASCETTDDCVIGQCGVIGDGRPGQACELANLPACARDEHCEFGWGVCMDGTCEPRCDWIGACGPGMLCDFVRADYGVCRPDPNYVPPPPPSSCVEADSPDSWCQTERGATLVCDWATQTCVAQYAALLLVDETFDCSDDDDSPGADLAGIRILLNGYGETYFSTFELGDGAANSHTDWTSVQTHQAPACGDSDPNWMSLGCDGAAVVLPGEGPMGAGWEVEVYTLNNWCGDGSDDGGIRVYLCPTFPPSVYDARLSCTRELGSSRDAIVMPVP